MHLKIITYYGCQYDTLNMALTQTYGKDTHVAFNVVCGLLWLQSGALRGKTKSPTNNVCNIRNLINN